MKLRRSLYARPVIVRGQHCTSRCQSVQSRAWDDAPGVHALDDRAGALARDLPETALHAILLEEPTGIRVITDDRLENVAAVQHGAMHQHATGSADHDRSFAELVTEQRCHRNHPDGFWVASTDPSAARHALADTVTRDGLRRVAVLSDGATRLVDRFGLLDWPSFLEVLAEQGPGAIIQQVRAAEGSDPDGRRWPRGKRQDDASAAYCYLS